MSKLKIVCIILGILHFIAMTFFALGPELAPLMVGFVDFPVAAILSPVLWLLIKLGCDNDAFILMLIVATASFVYPVIIYFLTKFFLKKFKY